MNSTENLDASLFANGLGGFEIILLSGMAAIPAVVSADTPGSDVHSIISNSGSLIASSSVCVSEKDLGASKVASIDHTIKIMREENIGYMREVALASSAKERQEALENIVKNKKAIVQLLSYKAEVSKCKDFSGTEKSKNENLSLNRRGLPKFQLASSAVKAFPNEEVFESVDHYLRTFESILNSSSLNLESQWAKLLPLCMTNGERAWVDKALLK